MPLHIHVHHHHDLAYLESRLMALSKEVADLQAAVADAVTRSANTAKSFHDQIAALQAQIAAGGLSQEDHDALVALLTPVQAIDPADPTTVPPSPAPAPANP